MLIAIGDYRGTEIEGILADASTVSIFKYFINKAYKYSIKSCFLFHRTGFIMEILETVKSNIFMNMLRLPFKPEKCLLYLEDILTEKLQLSFSKVSHNENHRKNVLFF